MYSNIFYKFLCIRYFDDFFSFRSGKKRKNKLMVTSIKYFIEAVAVIGGNISIPELQTVMSLEDQCFFFRKFFFMEKATQKEKVHGEPFLYSFQKVMIFESRF